MILDSIFYVVRGGIAWRQLPSEFPPPSTVWAIFARWVRAGVWQRIHDALVDPISRGDPMSPLRWTTKSTAQSAAELTIAGHRVSARIVAKLLKESGYSLQSNAKIVDGKQYPDRDEQFGYIKDRATEFIGADDPVNNVDTKKRNWSATSPQAGASTNLPAHPFSTTHSTAPI